MKRTWLSKWLLLYPHLGTAEGISCSGVPTEALQRRLWEGGENHHARFRSFLEAQWIYWPLFKKSTWYGSSERRDKQSDLNCHLPAFISGFISLPSSCAAALGRDPTSCLPRDGYWGDWSLSLRDADVDKTPPGRSGAWLDTEDRISFQTMHYDFAI